MHKRFVALLVASAMLAPFAATGKAMLIGSATEDQLVGWVKDYTKTHPDDAEAQFCLGRIYMTVWTTGAKSGIPYAGLAQGGLPAFEPMSSVIMHRNGDEVPIDSPGLMKMKMPMPLPAGAGEGSPQTKPADEVKTLMKAVEAYRAAVKLDAKKPIYHLALACSYEELAGAASLLPADFDWGKHEKLTDAETAAAEKALKSMVSDEQRVRDEASAALQGLMPRAGPMLSHVHTGDAEVQARVANVISHYWQGQAVAEYRAAYTARVEQDLKAPNFDTMNDGMISAEAGDRMLVLFKAVPETEKKGEGEKIRAAVGEMKGKPAIMWVF